MCPSHFCSFSAAAGAVSGFGHRYNTVSVFPWGETMTPNLSNQPPQAPAVPGVPAPGEDSTSGTAEALQGAGLGERAWATFQRDYLQLLEQRFGQWVAYRGDQQVGFAPTAGELYQECLRRGYQPDEFVVCPIEPVVGEMAIGLGDAACWIE
jgi:hypothetical protein